MVPPQYEHNGLFNEKIVLEIPELYHKTGAVKFNILLDVIIAKIVYPFSRDSEFGPFMLNPAARSYSHVYSCLSCNQIHILG